MTLEQLRIFVAVAEREHVTQAAEALSLTQSAVSGAVAALEARHGVRLFDRVGRSIVLNESGRAFLAEARGVLARAAAAQAALDDLGALRRGRLSIHASQTIASYWLPGYLVAFAAAYPGVDLDVAMGNTTDVARSVAEGSAELGFVEGEVDDAALAREVVASDRLIVVVARHHPWAKCDTLSVRDLLTSEWVLREPGSGTRSTFETALKAHIGLDGLKITMALPSNEAVIAAVAAGDGATAISMRVAESFLRAGAVVQAPFDLPARDYQLLRHPARYRSRAGDALVALITARGALLPGG